MQNEPELNPADQELEAALSSLQPLAARIDRDQLMYRLGQQAATRQTRFWRAISGLMVLAAGIGWSVSALRWDRPTESPALRVHHDRAPFPAPPPVQDPQINPPGGEYFRWRAAVLNGGLDALPISAHGGVKTEPIPTVETLLGLPPRPVTQPSLFHLNALFQLGGNT